MVSFLNEHCPNWVTVKCKPHPYENEYPTIAWCVSRIIFLELVQTEKDRSSTEPYSMLDFEDVMPKTAALYRRLASSIIGSSWCVMLDSEFRYMATLPELHKQGLFWTTVFEKKEFGFSKGSDAKNVLCRMQWKKVGYLPVRRGKNINFPSCDVWIAAKEHTAHIYHGKSWATTYRADQRKRRVGGSLIIIDYEEYLLWYYFSCCEVDNNNNNHQGSLSFVIWRNFTPDSWDFRLFELIAAVSKVNVMLACNFLHCHHGSDSMLDKVTFTRDLAESLIFGADDYEDIQGLSSGNVRGRHKQVGAYWKQELSSTGRVLVLMRIWHIEYVALIQIMRNGMGLNFS